MKTAIKNIALSAQDIEVRKKTCNQPWNKGKLLGQKPPLKLKEAWEIRVRLQLANNLRELALFNLPIDSKLRGCDLVKLKVRDVAHGADLPAGQELKGSAIAARTYQAGKHS